MKLHFEDKNGKLEEIAEVQTKETASEKIHSFLEKYNYNPYSIRMWVEKEEAATYVVYDVGSHSEFFKVEFDSVDAAQNFLVQTCSRI